MCFTLSQTRKSHVRHVFLFTIVNTRALYNPKYGTYILNTRDRSDRWDMVVWFISASLILAHNFCMTKFVSDMCQVDNLLPGWYSNFLHQHYKQEQCVSLFPRQGNHMSAMFFCLLLSTCKVKYFLNWLDTIPQNN
jgi:hypothetical protein